MENQAREITLVEKGMMKGYAKVKFPSDNRRGYDIRYIYVGNYHECTLDDMQQLKRGRVNAVLFFISMFTVFLGYSQTGAIEPWYAVAGLAALVFSGMYVITGLSTRRTGPRQMTEWEYEHGPRALLRNTKLSMVCHGIALLTVLLQLVLEGFTMAPERIFSIAMIVISAAANFAIGWFEAGTEYEIVPSEDTLEDVKNMELPQ